jgi:hypothetical protein
MWTSLDRRCGRICFLTVACCHAIEPGFRDSHANVTFLLIRPLVTHALEARNRSSESALTVSNACVRLATRPFIAVHWPAVGEALTRQQLSRHAAVTDGE